MAGSTLAARNDTPERSAMVQGWATRPVTFTGAPWRMAEDGTPGTLTASRSADPSPIARSWMTYSGSPFSSARGRLVSKSTTGSGGRAHRNAMAEVSIGSFMAVLLGSCAGRQLPPVHATRTPGSRRHQKVPELVRWLVPPLVPEETVRAAR